MKESQGFTKDDEVALYLLSLYEQNDTDNRYGQWINSMYQLRIVG